MTTNMIDLQDDQRSTATDLSVLAKQLATSRTTYGTEVSRDLV
jgi:hypothetical protein